jgi:hypothetical protein
MEDLGLIGLTIPEKPNSSRQQRQLSTKGRQLLKALETSRGDMT